MDEIVAGLRAAAETTRFRVLALLAHGELTVSELTQILGQSQPRVSRHLKLLMEAGLLERFREGTWVFYRLAEQGQGARLARALLEFVPAGDDSLERDRVRLGSVRRERAEAAAAYFRANAAEWHRIRSLYVDEIEVERAIAEAIGDHPVGDLLDVGTGTGRILEILGPRARRAIGVDLSREMLTIARANLDRTGQPHLQARQGDMYHLALPDEAFDLVVFHQVLHFADDPAAAIAEAARVLRPDGRLLLVDFAPHTVEFLRTEHAHRRLGFSDEEVDGWCRSVGLEGTVVRRLVGDPITVTIWLATHTAAFPAALSPIPELEHAS